METPLELIYLLPFTDLLVTCLFVVTCINFQVRDHPYESIFLLRFRVILFCLLLVVRRRKEVEKKNCTVYLGNKISTRRLVFCDAKTDPTITWEESAACPSTADREGGVAWRGHAEGEAVGGGVRDLALITSSWVVRAIIRPHCRYLISFLRKFRLLASRLVGSDGER